MRIFILSMLLLLAATGYAQKDFMRVYGTDKTACRIDLPAARKVYGGTIIKAVYGNLGINNTMRSAFEYACKLVEENIPTAYPLKVSVSLKDFKDDNSLASVETFPFGIHTDKAYDKRHKQTYGNPTFETDEEGLDFFRDSYDAKITFSSTQPFDYNLDVNGLDPDKYDFVTVAIQALLKAVGFTCQADESNGALVKSSMENQFTTMLLQGTPEENYQLATSGNAYIEPQSTHSGQKWLLASDAPYQPGISLSYFADSDNEESAIMQYGISKGSYIRHIGSAIQDFFSFCGWDRPILTGMSSTTIEGGNSSDVIAFQGLASNGSKSQSAAHVASSQTEETLDEYLSPRSELGITGNSVLLKDGSWETYDDLTKLLDNEKYARTADGHLRLKSVTTSNSWGPNGGYTNYKVKYKLYGYIPQKPAVAINQVSLSPTEEVANIKKLRSFGSLVTTSDLYLNLEVGIKNLEGTSQIMVEQTDADYPLPYTYAVNDVHSEKFTAYINKKYASTFLITYINANGQTTSDTLTVNYVNTPLKSLLMKHPYVDLESQDGEINYKVKSGSTSGLNYTISSLTTGEQKGTGRITDEEGSINVSSLNSGNYVLSVYNEGEKVGEIKWNKR